MLEDAWAGRILFFRRYEALSSEALFFRRYDASARKSQDKIDFFMPGALAVQFPFFFFGSWHPQCYCGALAVQFPFFFLAAAISHCPTGHLWPSGQMASGKKRLAFFFLVPWPMSFPVCANEKKTKIKKKAAKKKSCYINIKKKKSPFPFFLYGL